MHDEQDAEADAQRRIKIMKRNGGPELDAGKCQNIHTRCSLLRREVKRSRRPNESEIHKNIFLIS